jgi:hypothetical protein
MAKKPNITTIASGYYSRQALNNNFENLRDKFDNTLSLDGSIPNAMGADLDLNGNDLLNVGTLNTDVLKLDGTLVGVGDLNAAGATLSSISHTGDGSTVAFSTGYQAFITDNTQVYIDGVYQNKAGYSISGTTLTFSEAPPLNADIEIVVARTLDFGADDAANVNYNQGGTGSVNRTVLTKLQETVSVKDFGAVGDGVTDDTAAIQAAIDSNSGDVYFPTGTYKVSDTISVTRNLYGLTGGRNTGAVITTDGSLSNQAILKINASYLLISGLRVIGSAGDVANLVTGIEISDTNAYGFILEKANVQNCYVGVKILTYIVSLIECKVVQNSTNLSMYSTTTGTHSEINHINVHGGSFWGATDYAAFIGDDRFATNKPQNGWVINFMGS